MFQARSKSFLRKDEGYSKTTTPTPNSVLPLSTIPFEPFIDWHHLSAHDFSPFLLFFFFFFFSLSLSSNSVPSTFNVSGSSSTKVRYFSIVSRCKVKIERRCCCYSVSQISSRWAFNLLASVSVSLANTTSDDDRASGQRFHSNDTGCLRIKRPQSRDNCIIAWNSIANKFNNNVRTSINCSSAADKRARSS